MVLEYASLGSLADYGMYKKHTKFTDQDKKRLVRHVTSALAHLQSNRIAHRDVKTENVLVCMDTSKEQPEPMAKLADFGYAIYCGATSDKNNNNNDHAVWRTTLCGTLTCLPPEMLEEEDGGFCSPSYHALRVDAWSLGVFCYELVMDRPLFANSSNSRESLKQAIWQFEPRDPEIWSRGSTSRKILSAPSGGLIDFCAKLLARDPDERSSPAQALEHAWLVPSTNPSTACASNTTSSQKRKRVVSPLPDMETTPKKGIQRRRRRRRRRRQL
jgi:serine/threonine protein kinase